jgi:AraC-like DNA-binding protein
LVAAVAAGEMRLEALVRGSYPGRPMPDGVLPQVSTIGFWDAVRDQAWGLGEHRNEGIEITYLDNGSLGFVVDGRSKPLQPGHLTITRPWQPHSVGNPNVAASRLYWLILDVGVRQPHQSWKWPPWLVLSPSDLRELTSMLRENEQPVWPGTAEIGRCFADIGHLIETSRSGTLPVSRLILLKRLEEELYEPWTLELMAEKSGLARTRFAHYCRKLTNLPPMEYLQRQRVERARQLLADSRQSITEIAMHCGFTSGAYFSSVFRRHFHCAPSEYREAQRAACPRSSPK